MRENRPVSGHVPVAHGQKVAHGRKIIGKFEQKIDFGEKKCIWPNFWSNLKKSDF